MDLAEALQYLIDNNATIRFGPGGQTNVFLGGWWQLIPKDRKGATPESLVLLVEKIKESREE